MKKLLGSLMVFFTISVFASSYKGLLDQTDSYPTRAFEYESLMIYIIGVIFFIAGFFISKYELVTSIKKFLKEKLSKR